MSLRMSTVLRWVRRLRMSRKMSVRSTMGSEVQQVRRPTRAVTPEDLERGTPLYCVWEITLACDLGCRHCGSRAGKARPDELSTKECLEVVDQLAKLGIREVTLIGGEAYLREDWPEIAAEITRQGMVCSMTTGGRDLSAERVEQAVASGIKLISVSLDGLQQTHDALRGRKGAFESALASAKRIADSPIRLGANTQINRLSLPELPALVDVLVELGINAWQIQLTVPMGRAADRPELLLQPYDLLEVFPLLAYLKSTKLTPNGIGLYPGNNIGYFGPYEQLLRFRGEEGVHWSGCSAGKWSIGLEADGKIKGCPSLPTQHYTGANVRDLSIAETVATTPELKYLRERTVEDLWGYCRTCYYAAECKAGCSWTSHSLLGKTGNNPYCIHRAMDFERRGQRERVVKVEGASGKPFDTGRFEIVVEDLEERAPLELRTILGRSQEEVASLKGDAPSIWSLEHIREALKSS
ncbi:radical SAM protein [Lujinxingia vulgaris]|uniref:Radical SAM protein n=2 Tax=Lujinxingia vulgaris TaxID=2600176 RepID=A0A5C6XD42_9DELT|nr:radical SAM protein [Lujinxingia vulgaris]